MKKLVVVVVIAIPLLGVILAPPGAAQKRASVGRAAAPTPHQLLVLKVTGSTRYTDKEILAASGLQLGQDAAEGDFKEAAQRLGESGLFSNVVYSFSYSDAGIKVEFQLTDNDKVKLVPAQFENFVWFTDAELLAVLRRRVPLFEQLLPESGRMADQVTEALQALLDEKHLPGRVDFLREEKQDGGEVTGFEYRVEEVSIHVRNVEFPGSSPEQSAFLTTGIRRLVGVEYSRSTLAAVAKDDLLPLLLERGYLKAAFGASDAHVVTESAAGAAANDQDEIEVDASLPVTPGKVYSVSGVTWKGNSAVSTDEASRLFHLATGQPADSVRLEHDAETLTRLYHSRGYMTVQIKPNAQIDDRKSTVHYEINITEGDLYKMGELEILGVDTPSKDRLREAWKLREGQPYDAEYTKKFLDDAMPLLPKGFQYTVNVNEDLDTKSKTVDVTIHFKMQ